jgi:hypothetical protein
VRFNVPERGYDERLDARLVAEPTIFATHVPTLVRDADLHSVLAYYVTWPRSTMSEQSTCAALIDPETGEVLGTDCERGYILGRPAGPEHRRSTTPCTGRAAAWARLAADEDEAVTSFERHVRELELLQAPPALVRRARRAVTDEVGHRQLALARATVHHGAEVRFGGPRSSADPLLQPLDVARDVAAGGALNELVNVALLLEAAREAEPADAGALIRIASDEVEHAALAWDTLRWLHRSLSPGERRVVEAELRPRALPAPLMGLDESGSRRAAAAAFEVVRVLTEQLRSAHGHASTPGTLT